MEIFLISASLSALFFSLIRIRACFSADLFTLPVGTGLALSPVEKLEVSMILRKVICRAPLWGLSLAGTMLVVACAGGPLTTREKGTLGGAALGAGTGAIIGGATGSPGTGALIGGALGGLGGAAVGGELQSQEQVQAEQQRKIEEQQREIERQQLEELKRQREY